MIRTILCPLMVMVLVQQARIAEGAPGTPVALPFLKVERMPFVPIIEAQVSGKTGRFLLDSGSTISLITPEFQKQLGLKASVVGEAMVRGVNGTKKVKNKEVRIPKLSFGKTFRIGPVKGRIYDLKHINRFMSKPLAGILGVDTLSQLNPSFDFPNNCLILNAKPIGTPIRSAFKPTRTEAVITIGGKDYDFVVDTAATTTAISQTSWPAFSKGQDIKTLRGRMAGSTGTRIVERHVALLPKLALGKTVAKKVGVFKGTKSSLLGLDVLRRFRVTFDFKNKQLLLADSADVPEEVVQ